MVPGRKVAFIRLDQFATGATDGIEAAIKGATGDGATAIILDLRGNPGGYVERGRRRREPVRRATGRSTESVDASGTEKDVPVKPGGLATGIPLVVLTDGGTASSAEIVTGAIQDADRGTVVGDKTFGTGTVLGRFDLVGRLVPADRRRALAHPGRPADLARGPRAGRQGDAARHRRAAAPRRHPGHDRRSWRGDDSQLLKAWSCLRGS